MFNFSGKKNTSTKVIDKIWMTQSAKWRECISMYEADPLYVFIAWFDETYQQLEKIFKTESAMDIPCFIAREINHHQLQQKNVVFVEHCPLRGKEQALFSELQLSKVQVLSALDEPLFQHFGGEKIVQLMKQMGMKETESIENSMISNAIRNAQEKIGKEVLIENAARSQSDWLKNNLK